MFKSHEVEDGLSTIFGINFHAFFKARMKDCNKTTMNHIFQLLKKDELIKVE
jgi:hypothetical protein